jgi:hypothetical protein
MDLVAGLSQRVSASSYVASDSVEGDAATLNGVMGEEAVVVLSL